MALPLALLTALWLGVSTSISPCPLATNITAMSFVSSRLGTRGSALWAGAVYTLGRSLTYVLLGYLIVEAAVNVPWLSQSLQSLNQVLGPVLIVAGMCLLGLIRVDFPRLLPSGALASRWLGRGQAGALLLGIVLALAFCPVSAALFFGGLVPLAVQADASVAMSLAYGIGTGLPVLAFAVLVSLGAAYVNTAFQALAKLERYTKGVTGTVFVLVGVYYVLAYVFEVVP